MFQCFNWDPWSTKICYKNYWSIDEGSGKKPMQNQNKLITSCKVPCWAIIGKKCITAPHLTFMFKYILRKLIFPNQLKIAKVASLFKEPQNFINCRLTPIIKKFSNFLRTLDIQLRYYILKLSLTGEEGLKFQWKNQLALGAALLILAKSFPKILIIKRGLKRILRSYKFFFYEAWYKYMFFCCIFLIIER